MNKSSVKFFLVLITILLVVQALVYFSLNFQDVKDLLGSSKDSVESLDYKSIRLSKFSGQNNPSTTIKKCPFTTNQQPSHKPAIFSEIAWMGGVDQGNKEWFKIQKTTAGKIDIKGWQVINKNGRLFINVDNSTILSDQQAFLTFYRGPDFKGAIKNTSEALKIFDSNCNLIDEASAQPLWPAGNNDKKLTMKRSANLTWYDDGTKKKASKKSKDQEEYSVDLPAQPVDQLIISRVQAGSEISSQDEFIEIYNPTNQDLNLENLSLKKRTRSGREYTLVSPSKFKGTLKTKEYFIIAHKEYIGELNLSYSNHSSPIAYSHNSIILYDTTGQVINEVSYERINKDEIWQNEKSPQEGD
ncbi:TPA: hypothetical protein DGT35_01815 [Patescibacteria group bacterium]|nr:hypothetical protein [Patescibacteria group bacterium]